MKEVITIDGPSGSGKSTISKLLAKKLGYKYLDTGALYRAVAWKVKEEDAEIDDEEALNGVLGNIDINLSGKKIFVNGVDVTALIRTAEIGDLSSRVSNYHRRPFRIREEYHLKAPGKKTWLQIS